MSQKAGLRSVAKNDLSSQAGKDKATCLHRLLPDATLRTLRRYEHHQSVAKCVRWQQCGSSAQACRPHSVRKEGSRLLARPVASGLIHSIAHGGRAQAELLCHTTAAESRVRGAVQRSARYCTGPVVCRQLERKKERQTGRKKESLSAAGVTG